MTRYGINFARTINRVLWLFSTGPASIWRELATLVLARTSENHFSEVNLQEVQKVCNTMISDVCRVYGCDNPEKLLPEALIKPNVVCKAPGSDGRMVVYSDRPSRPLLFTADV